MARPRSDLATEQVDEDLIVLDSRRNQVHQLNATASLVWHSLVTNDTVEAIADKLAERFDTSRSVALKDVKKLIRELDNLGLLESNMEAPDGGIEGGQK